MSWGSFLDAYTLRARVYPGLLVLAPVAVTMASVLPLHVTALSVLVSILMSVGGLYLLSHLVRQQGKSKEAALWRSWGGKPTTVALRFRTAEASGPRDVVRARLAKIASDVRLPTAEEERADPHDADQCYEAAVAVLREKTRDPVKFPIVCAENISYGFRRNTWAIRPVGVVAAASALLLAVAYGSAADGRSFDAIPIVWTAAIVDSVLLIFWLAVPTSRWVRAASDSYTLALFGAAAAICD